MTSSTDTQNRGGRPPVDGKPGKTPMRYLRVGDELWFAANAKAKANGTSIPALVREWLRQYVAGDR